jgi:nucleoside-diphosphate-sugar epimerase
MKILLTGAGGYIGSAVAETLLAAGHDVTGVVRRLEPVRALEARGLRSLQADLRQPAPVLDALRGHEALVHTALDRSDLPANTRTLQALLEGARRSGTVRRVLITSGLWVLGDAAGGTLDETSPPRPPAAVAFRVSHERETLDMARGTRETAVVRPGLVYGGSRGILAEMFREAADQGAVRIVGQGGNRWAMVQVEDLAQLYRLALERPLRDLRVFHGTNEAGETAREIAQAALTAAGRGGTPQEVPLVLARQAVGPLAEAFALDQPVSAARTREALGWTPCSRSFVREVDRWFEEWRTGR